MARTIIDLIFFYLLFVKDMLRIIGDCHGKTDRISDKYYHDQARVEGRTYLKILADAENKGVKHTLQIGDLGWRKDLECMKNVDLKFHKMLLGNHDDYDNILPHSIGDYGIMMHGGVTFGYFRGEYSIDKERRTSVSEIKKSGKTWWDQEEMSYTQMQEAIDFFTGRSIDLFISHGAPAFLIPCLVPIIRYANSRTSIALEHIHNLANIKRLKVLYSCSTMRITIGNSNSICFLVTLLNLETTMVKNMLRIIGIILGVLSIILVSPIIILACCIIIPLGILEILLYLFIGYVQWSFTGESFILDEFKKQIAFIRKYGIPS